MKKIFIYLLVLVVFACERAKPDSEVSFPLLISEGMVLQRDQMIQIWGKGIPGKKVRVSLAGAISSTEVLGDSSWRVQLPPLPAGGPYDLQVNLQIIKDVYLGDVWVAGGQSNMEWALKSEVIGAAEEFANPDFPAIRFFKVPKSYSAKEEDELAGGQWKVANAANLPDFSAVAWFFAKRNHMEINVPVGIIESNWGGTPAEGWTEAKVLAAINDRSYSQEAKDIVENPLKWKEEILSNDKRREMRDLLVKRPDSLMAVEASGLAFDDSNWKRIQLPAANPLEHIVWVRRKFNLSSTSGLTLVLPHISQMAFIYINGQQVHYKDWVEPMPELEIPSSILKTGQNVLTLRVASSWNGNPQVGKTGEMYFSQNGKQISLEGTWAYSNNMLEPQLPKVEALHKKPGFMYNAMIDPLTFYPIKGVIWYQGESNAALHAEYKELFTAMIQNWRSRWGIGNFPFLFVQLANFMEPKEIQPESNWAYLREAQTQTLELPFTGMATIIDIGEADDIHPRNKKDVGERLWLQARKVAFGENILASGPVLKEVNRDGMTLYVHFSEIGNGLELTVGDKVKGFILEDAEGQFEIAEGEISGKDQVLLPIPEGLVPVGVRYAWADNPEVNLVNHLKLPAVPFRAEIK
jgi:sialate O-acetylesterase